MEHNLVLVRSGNLEEAGILSDELAAAPGASKREHVPDTPADRRATKALDPGQSQALLFTAPDEAGNIPFHAPFPATAE